MALADEFNVSITEMLRGVDERALAAASRGLSDAYRSGADPHVQDDLNVAAAYAAVRAPATFAASASVFDVVARALPGFVPSSHLDLGAGIGSAAWAAHATWPSFQDATLLDRSDALIDLGRSIAQWNWDWRVADLGTTTELPAADLVTASYAMGELDRGTRASILRAAWEATRGVFVVIEPGTPRGFATILEIRDALIAGAATLLAPCPHTDACPMPSGKWCHFPARLDRSPLHRRIKDVELPYEDERFSYVAFTRLAMRPAPGRIVGHPRRPRRRVHLEVCTPTGIRDVVVGRSDRERYRAAKALTWGAAVPRELA